MEQIRIRCRGVILHAGKLLVVQHAGGRDFYALPGGHLDFGESPTECMRRELVEELGVVPELGVLIAVYSFVKDGVQSIEFFFEILNGEAYVGHATQEKSHAHEIAEVRWVLPEEAVRILPFEFHTLWRSGDMHLQTPHFLKE